MIKEQLINITRGLLDINMDLIFLLRLRKDDLETWVVCIRNRVDQMGRKKLDIYFGLIFNES